MGPQESPRSAGRHVRGHSPHEYRFLVHMAHAGSCLEVHRAAESEWMGYAMMRVFVCSAAFAAALLLSGCGAGSLSEVEQQSLAAAATAAPKLQPGDKI